MTTLNPTRKRLPGKFYKGDSVYITEGLYAGEDGIIVKNYWNYKDCEIQLYNSHIYPGMIWYKWSSLRLDNFVSSVPEPDAEDII